MNKTSSFNIDVSIIIPIHNGSKWMKNCFESILTQTAVEELKIEICVCNDASSDDTEDLLKYWKKEFEKKSICFKKYENINGLPKGVGYSKNKAVSISTGRYLCFQDVDDVMRPQRIMLQYKEAIKLSTDTLVGSQFTREPDNSTIRYTKWSNQLTEEQLYTQIYTSHGPTLIMPTWFCHRDVFNRVGGFSEEGKGTPEDLIFFYKHLELNGKLHRVNEELLVYTYHQEATTFSVHESTIWKIRVEKLEYDVLTKWEKFTIWNAGKQGRKLYNSLSEENKKKITAMCDVDIKKIGKRYTPYNSAKRKNEMPINIINFKDAQPPFVICVKLDMTGGSFEKNLDSLKLKEGENFVYFC